MSVCLWLNQTWPNPLTVRFPWTAPLCVHDTKGLLTSPKKGLERDCAKSRLQPWCKLSPRGVNRSENVFISRHLNLFRKQRHATDRHHRPSTVAERWTLVNKPFKFNRSKSTFAPDRLYLHVQKRELFTKLESSGLFHTPLLGWMLGSSWYWQVVRAHAFFGEGPGLSWLMFVFRNFRTISIRIATIVVVVLRKLHSVTTILESGKVFHFVEHCIFCLIS